MVLFHLEANPAIVCIAIVMIVYSISGEVPYDCDDLYRYYAGVCTWGGVGRRGSVPVPYSHARACMLPRIVFVSSVDVDSSESCKYILIMAGQSVEASAEMLKNAVIDDPTAEHTATVGTLY